MRLFGSAVVRQADLDAEVADDVKLALDEAVSGPLVDGAGGTVEVHATLGADDVRFEVRSAASGDAVAGDGFPRGADLVRALFADAAVATDDGVRVLRFGLASRVSG